MNAKQALKEQIDMSRAFLDGTLADVTDEQCHHKPGGEAHPIGATYGHLATAEDQIVNGVVRGATPLMMGEWAGKTGLSEPPPAPGGDLLGWSNRVVVDIPALREYTRAVRDATDAYLDSLSDDDIGAEKEVPGFGKHPLIWYLGLAAAIHPANHCGEIAALKGILGAKGYPF